MPLTAPVPVNEPSHGFSVDVVGVRPDVFHWLTVPSAARR